MLLKNRKTMLYEHLVKIIFFGEAIILFYQNISTGLQAIVTAQINATLLSNSLLYIRLKIFSIFHKHFNFSLTFTENVANYSRLNVSVNEIKEWNKEKKWEASNCRLHSVDYSKFCRIQELYDPVTNTLRSFVDFDLFYSLNCVCVHNKWIVH